MRKAQSFLVASCAAVAVTAFGVASAAAETGWSMYGGNY